MIKKAALFIIILLLATSIAYATKSINDFTIPSDYSKQSSDGKYFIPKTYDNPRFIIIKYNGSDDLFTNSSLYELWEGSEKNTFYFSNHQISDIGAIELIEIDGEKFIVSSQYASTIKDEDYLNNAMKSILEFNQLNNVNPIVP